jgi:hypothetical protein
VTAKPKKPEQMRIPDGTIEEIVDWVDGDPQRAFLALNAEQAKEQPRVTLVQGLETLAYDPDGLYDFTGSQDLYYPGYGFQDEDGEVSPAHASPGMDPVMFVPAGGQALPIPPRDGNWVPHSGTMGTDRPSRSDDNPRDEPKD